MENAYFKCYELYHKIGKELPSELQAKYYVALMEYGLYGIEPTDAVIKSLLQGPIYSIQKSEEIKKKQSDGGKKHTGNQHTTGDAKWKAQKKAVEVCGSIMEVDGSTMEDNGRKKNRSIEDNINIKKENIKEKKCYLENVWLSDEEYNKLTASYGKQVIEEYIVKLSDYMLSKDKVYTDHYRTILKRLAKSGVKKKGEHVNDGDEPYDFSKDKIILPVRKRQWEISK